MEEKFENCTRSNHRNEDEKVALTKRLNIIAGQVKGIQQMIADDRYCDEVLIQIASIANSLKSLGNEILKGHMKTCMVEDITAGNLEVVDYIMDLFGKLK